MKITYAPPFEGQAGTEVAWLELEESDQRSGGEPGFGMPMGPSGGGSVNLMFDGSGRLSQLEFMEPHTCFGAPADPEAETLDVPLHCEHEPLFDDLVIWFTSEPPDPEQDPALVIKRYFEVGGVELHFHDDGRLLRIDVFEATKLLHQEALAQAQAPDWLDRAPDLQVINRDEERALRETVHRSDEAVERLLGELERAEDLPTAIEARRRLEAAARVIEAARELHRLFWHEDAVFVELTPEERQEIDHAAKWLARALARYDRLGV
jgi:hypothetical protein